MKRSTEPILTTHTGSLPRPPKVLGALKRRDRGEGDGEALDEQVRAAVAGVVRRRAEADVSVVNDGEAAKVGYSTYVTERLDGFCGEAPSGHARRPGRVPRVPTASDGRYRLRDAHVRRSRLY